MHRFPKPGTRTSTGTREPAEKWKSLGSHLRGSGGGAQQHPHPLGGSDPVQFENHCSVGFILPLDQRTVIPAPCAQLARAPAPPLTRSSCLWVSSRDTAVVSFSCLLTVWNRFSVAILMVPSKRVFLAAVFWMWAQRDS